ncbi:MAG: hypothetical protein Q4Q07_08415 [Tissierellia bacterium]|nr:hypothetical protein [Tissierellia bacterium]
MDRNSGNNCRGTNTGKQDGDYNIIITSKLPEGTKYTLAYEKCNDILATAGNSITTTPDRDWNLRFVIPDTYGTPTTVLTNGQNITVKVSQPRVDATTSPVSDLLDLVGPVITVSNVTETVNIKLEDKDILKVKLDDKNLKGIKITNTELPLGVTLEKIADENGKPVYQLKGTPRDVITAEDNFIITYTATDKFGNTSEKKVNVVINNQEKTEKPIIDKIDEGDKTVKITPPTDADSVIVTWPDGKVTEMTKGEDGKWKDKDNKEIPFEDGKLVVPVPKGTELKNLDIVKATAQDKANNKLPSDEDLKAVGGKSVPPTAKQDETKENGNPTISGTGIPGSDINVYDPNTRD